MGGKERRGKNRWGGEVRERRGERGGKEWGGKIEVGRGSKRGEGR